MTSMVTNVAAKAALSTLRSISTEMDKVQLWASSGLRISSASDNAAYWSIATTMRSDKKATAAVYDALGLGSATVDTAYTGITSAISVLDEFKAKVIAAKEPGVDASKVQSELDQLKLQFTSIAKSATFSGQNWLSTSITDIHDPKQNKTSVVASFARDNNGVVAVHSMDLDLSDISLFNSTGGGILQKDPSSPGSIGGLRSASGSNMGTIAVQFPLAFSGPLVFASNANAITFDITVDADNPADTPSPGPGTTTSVTINRSLVDSVFPSLNGTISNLSQFTGVLRSALLPLGVAPTIGGGGTSTTSWGLISLGTSGNTGTSLSVANVNSTMSSGLTGGLINSPQTSYGSRPSVTATWGGSFSVDSKVHITVPVSVNGVSKQMVIDRSLVDSALGTSNGSINTIQDFVTVLNAGFSAQGTGVVASTGAGSSINFAADPNVYPQAGPRATMRISPSYDDLGPSADFDIQDVDVTTRANLDNYISGIEVMRTRLNTAGATLGSVQKRIELQSDFTQTLMNNLDKGIGRLVDADMNETSTRLKALQVQEQLSTQALNIANNQSQLIGQLFR